MCFVDFNGLAYYCREFGLCITIAWFASAIQLADWMTVSSSKYKARVFSWKKHEKMMGHVVLGLKESDL